MGGDDIIRSTNSVSDLDKTSFLPVRRSCRQPWSRLLLRPPLSFSYPPPPFRTSRPVCTASFCLSGLSRAAPEVHEKIEIRNRVTD